MKKLSIALNAALPVVLLSTPITNVQANDAVKLSQSGELEVTVTANRRPENLLNTLAPTTLITREDIEKTQATSLAEVLARVPGISIANDGGAGKSTSVFIRGTSSGQILVLVDGVRHGSATLGSTAFQYLPLENVERIEVVRGPRSSLYGSDAIGGVIQIFTNKSETGFKPSLNVSMGSNNTYKAGANFAGGNERTTYNLNVQGEETSGIDSRGFHTAFDPVTFASIIVPEQDRDDYSSRSVSLNVGQQFSSALKGELTLLHAEGDTDYDGGFVNETDFVQRVVTASLKAKLSEKLNVDFKLGQSRDESDNFNNGSFQSQFDTKRDTASVIANFIPNNTNNFILGTDWYDAKVESTTAYDVSSRDNTGVFAGYSQKFDKADFDLSLRYDDNEQFGSAKTGNFAVGFNINNNLRAKASYGRAFLAPTFNQLYFPFDFGNPNLTPEKSENYEFGFDGRLANTNWGINFFQNDINDLIVTTADFSTSENTDKTRIRGLELSLNTELAGFNFNTNFTAQKPEIKSGVNAGNILIRRPERILNIGINRQLGRFNLGANIHAESKRFNNPSNSTSLPGFATLDLHGGYQVSKNLNLGLKIGNLFDKDYQLSETYNQDGINGLLTIKYAPK